MVPSALERGKTPPERRASITSTGGSGGGGGGGGAERRGSTTSVAESVVAAAVNANPSWQLTPAYSLGGATRGVTSIATKADTHAKEAASTAMKIASISSAGTAAASAATTEVAKQPRVRLKVTLLCEHGIYVQMDDLHRLENTPADEDASPTFELALKVPPQDGGEGGCGDGGAAPDAAEPQSPRSVLPPSLEEALSMTLDFEHVASAEILGVQDSMSMKAAFGMEGKYFNPRVQQSEHFIEPWRYVRGDLMRPTPHQRGVL